MKAIGLPNVAPPRAPPLSASDQTHAGTVPSHQGRKESRRGGKGATMSFYRGQASFMAGSDLPIGVNDNIDQVQEERCDQSVDLSRQCIQQFFARRTLSTTLILETKSGMTWQQTSGRGFASCPMHASFPASLNQTQIAEIRRKIKVTLTKRGAPLDSFCPSLPSEGMIGSAPRFYSCGKPCSYNSFGALLIIHSGPCSPHGTPTKTVQSTPRLQPRPVV